MNIYVHLRTIQLRTCRPQTVIPYLLQRLRMILVVLAPDAGGFWSMSIQSSMSHTHFFHATRFRFFLPRPLYMKQQEGDKVGDKREPSGKTQKTMVEHELSWDNKKTQSE